MSIRTRKSPPIIVTDVPQTVAVSRSELSDIHICNYGGPDIEGSTAYVMVTDEEGRADVSSKDFTQYIPYGDSYSVELEHTGPVTVVCASGETSIIQVTAVE